MATKRKRTARSSAKSKKKTIKKTTPPPSPGSESPVRAIVCLKQIDDMKRFEDTEDCFILGFDPAEPVVPSKLSFDLNQPPSDDDVSIIAEKGQVACRDFPHSRHLCSKFPFKSTPHVSHCEMCYCYVCDSAAPCKYWTLAQHCNAENVGCWNDQRRKVRKQIPVAAAARYPQII